MIIFRNQIFPENEHISERYWYCGTNHADTWIEVSGTIRQTML
jgi:hypothetical protein